MLLTGSGVYPFLLHVTSQTCIPLLHIEIARFVTDRFRYRGLFEIGNVECLGRCEPRLDWVRDIEFSDMVIQMRPWLQHVALDHNAASNVSWTTLISGVALPATRGDNRRASMQAGYYEVGPTALSTDRYTRNAKTSACRSAFGVV